MRSQPLQRTRRLGNLIRGQSVKNQGEGWAACQGEFAKQKKRKRPDGIPVGPFRLSSFLELLTKKGGEVNTAHSNPNTESRP
jgi:hypothetical protein